VTSSARSDTALLSWLFESSPSSQSDFDGDDGVNEDSSPDDLESVDAAFETLEESLLTGIAV
jgi:hypothetical protein